MKTLLTYDKFIVCEKNKSIENAYNSINEEHLIKIINENCKIYDFANKFMQIYRGINSTENFLFFNSNDFERKSSGIATKNYYTYIVDNSKMWENYPKRSKALIGIKSKDIAKSYGNLYNIVPFDNAKFGICPSSDFIFSFKYLKERKFDAIDFNTLLKNFYEDIFKEKLNDDTSDIFLKSLKRFDDLEQRDFITKRVKSLKIFFMKEFWMNFIYQNKNNLSFFDFIVEIIFNPYKNQFKNWNWTTKTSEKFPFKKEIWTNSSVILIKNEIFHEISQKINKT